MKKITKCRACGSKALTPAFTMLHQSETRWFWNGRDRKGGYVLCDPSHDARACGLLQAAYETAPLPTAPSGRHRSNRDQLRAVATESLELLSGRDCSALDVGCNDGTLLSYYPRWVERYGIDLDDVVDGVGEWATTTKAAFPSKDADAAFGDKKFDIITAVSVLEHVDDPRALIARVKSLLTEDGVFALETLYAPMTLTRNSIEALQTGVSSLFSLSVLEWLLRENDLKIFKGALTEKDGGSIRLFITHKETESFDFDPWFERLAQLWDEENALAMRALQPYQSFEQRAASIRTAFVEQLEDIAGRGENAHILGADASTLAFLEWIGPAAKVITAAVDSAALRESTTLGEKGIRIISETDCRTAEPDFLIAPARYKQEMLERWRESILLGARMLFATPRPHEINASNFAAEFAKTLASGDAQGDVESLRSILSVAGGPRLIADNKEQSAVG